MVCHWPRRHASCPVITIMTPRAHANLGRLTHMGGSDAQVRRTTRNNAGRATCVEAFGKMLSKLCSKRERAESLFSSKLPRVSHAVGLLEAHCASQRKRHI